MLVLYFNFGQLFFLELLLDFAVDQPVEAHYLIFEVDLLVRAHLPPLFSKALVRGIKLRLDKLI